MRRASSLALLALLGCDRPQSLVLCHNANCAGPVDPSRDDTIEALGESLALDYRGRPAIDGMEMDSFWYGAEGRCLFAHDGDSTAGHVDARVAAQAIADSWDRAGPIGWRDGRYVVLVELKGFVGGFSDEHTPAQRELHAECALDLLAIFDDTAGRADRQVRVIFDSASPALLRTLVGRPRWPGRRSGERVEVYLSADFQDPTTFGFLNEPLSDFTDGLDLDVAEFHADWVTDGQLEAFRSLDLKLCLWMFSATEETFSAIQRIRPDYVDTGEALLLRRWEEY
jgi:hypothetical protein